MGTYLKSIYKLGDKKRLSAVGRQPTLATPGHGPAPQAGGAAVGTGLGPPTSGPAGLSAPRVQQGYASAGGGD